MTRSLGLANEHSHWPRGLTVTPPPRLYALWQKSINLVQAASHSRDTLLGGAGEHLWERRSLENPNKSPMKQSTNARAKERGMLVRNRKGTEIYSGAAGQKSLPSNRESSGCWQ